MRRRNLALPSGSTAPGHASPLVHGGRNYVVGTGNGSASRFIFQDNFD